MEKKGKLPAVAIDDRLKLAYTDISGNTYYEFIDDGAMTYKRFVSAQIAERFMRLGLTPEFLKIAIDKGLSVCYDKTKTEEKKMQDLSQIFYALKARANYVAEEDQYLRLACVYFMLPGEPVGEMVEQWTLRKIALMAENQDAKDFFLLAAIKRIHNLYDFCVDDMSEFFKMAQMRLQTAPTLPQ